MRIQDIHDIVRIIEKYGNSENHSLDFQELAEHESYFANFYKTLTEGSIQSDAEMAQKIYGDNFSPAKYKTLKTYFISRTINNISFLDVSKSDRSDYTKAIYKAFKYQFFVSLLLTLGSRAGAMHFAKRLLILATKYEFHSIIIFLLSEFRKDFLQSGKEREYRKYLKLYEDRIQLVMNESRIISLEEQITIHFSKSLFVPDNIGKQVSIAVKKVDKLLKNGDTYFGRISYYRLLYISNQVNGEPLKSAAACDQAIKYLESMPHMTPRSRFAEFALYKLENYILARDYKNGKKAAEYCSKHINVGMNLWFSYKEYEFLLMMQTMNFAEAHKIYNEVISHERFESRSQLLRDKWQLLGFHIKYVIQSNSSAQRMDHAKFKKSYLIRNKDFKERLFDSPTYRKDKRGFNVAILVLNILVALEENKLDLLLLQEDALSSYRFKYLNEKHCHQSFILLKLIRLVTKNDFDLERIEKKASALEKELDTHKLAPGEIFESIQVLPPQWVWSRIKAILASRK